MKYYGKNGISYDLSDKPIASGGEGDIFRISDNSGLVAKIYNKAHVCDITRQRKIKAMSTFQRADVIRHTSWPQDVLYDENHNLCGFTMKYFKNTTGLDLVLSDSSINWKKRIAIAYNLCALVEEIHWIGQCIGDMNPANFGVSVEDGSCYVYAFDADSFHLKMEIHGVEQDLPCVVGLAQYYAPELQRKIDGGVNLRTINPAQTFSKETDRFALAVLIFQLLFNGFHPFTAALVPSYGSSTVVRRAEKNILYQVSPFFNPTDGICPPPSAPPLCILPPEIQKMFRKAFLESNRPTATEWETALSGLWNGLRECSNNKEHYYWSGSAFCPWCNRPERGSDVTREIEISNAEASRGCTKTLVLADREKVSVNIPIGTADGYIVRVPNRGTPGRFGGRNGTLIINVKVTQGQKIVLKKKKYALIPIVIISILLLTMGIWFGMDYKAALPVLMGYKEAEQNALTCGITTKDVGSGGIGPKRLEEFLVYYKCSKLWAPVIVKISGLDWDMQALKETKFSICYGHSSKKYTIFLMVREGFTQAQAEYAVEQCEKQCNVNWREKAVENGTQWIQHKKEYENETVDRKELICYLTNNQFTQEEAEYAAGLLLGR